jgi:hypothetical protein
MKLFTLIAFSMSLFAVSAYQPLTTFEPGAYRAETVTTICFFISSGCHKSHAAEVLAAINKHPGEYISHSTTSTKCGMHSLIVYK